MADWPIWPDVSSYWSKMPTDPKDEKRSRRCHRQRRQSHAHCDGRGAGGQDLAAKALGKKGGAARAARMTPERPGRDRRGARHRLAGLSAVRDLGTRADGAGRVQFAVHSCGLAWWRSSWRRPARPPGCQARRKWRRSNRSAVPALWRNRRRSRTLGHPPSRQTAAQPPPASRSPPRRPGSRRSRYPSGLAARRPGSGLCRRPRSWPRIITVNGQRDMSDPLEGLEQEFNSLDAQREACEAYITSQKHEGWTVVACSLRLPLARHPLRLGDPSGRQLIRCRTSSVASNSWSAPWYPAD